MTAFLQDLRYAIRSLVSSPGFTAVAVLTLALGVGANSAIFSALQAVVLRDLPYDEPDRIAVMWTWNLQQNLRTDLYLNFRDWKDQSRQFEQMTAYLRPEFTRGTLTGDGESVRVNVGLVGPGFFELLGTAPLAGRTFGTEDFTERATAVVDQSRSLAAAVWRRHANDRAHDSGRRRECGSRRRHAAGIRAAHGRRPALAAALVRTRTGSRRAAGARTR